MNIRGFVVSIYVLAFLLALGGVVGIPETAWTYIQDWEIALFAFYILIGFCGVLLAFWVYQDGQSLHDLNEKIYAFQKKIDEFENPQKKK